MSQKQETKGITDEYYQFVGGSYDGQFLRVSTEELKKLIRVPDQLKVGFNIDGDPDNGEIIHPQIYNYIPSENHYEFVEDAK